jgi:polysaccharide biosynthesis/export protein
MQPARLGGLWCFALSGLYGILALAPPSRAQAVLGTPQVETPQQTNDRIRELSAAAARSGPHDYIIGPGDVITIDVFDVKELSRDVRVSQTGTIGIPLVPVRLHVAGLTELQAEQKISEVLEVNGLVTHADVSVSIKERKSRPITVVGAVNHPLVYEAERQETLLEVLAEAGGLANDAGDQVIVTRAVPEMTFDEANPASGGSADSAPKSPRPANSQGKPLDAAASNPPGNPPANATSANPSAAEPPELPVADQTPARSFAGAAAAGVPTDTITVSLNELMETGNMRNNIILQAGDVVTVPHSGIVYVLGAVQRPGGFVLTNDREQLTTLKILALAGGFTNTAKSSHAVVIRKDATGKQHEVDVDLKKIRNRQEEDLQLQPSDILYIPESGARQALVRSVEFGVALGSGVALYRLAYH